MYLNRVITDPMVNQYVSKQLFFRFNLLPEVSKISLPVLYMTGTTNCFHLYSAAKKTAAAMTNAKLEFIPFENVGLVGLDAREQGIAEIKRFTSKFHSN